ncbi:MAG: DUF1211 domain-containing protein [Saprospiraceae bacterium]|nr:DUF1211 domain-containing protein [Saprospiraceae bacterium]
MQRNRMEAFSDGVLAIIITIMVLEMKIPHGAEFSDLKPLIPVILSYVLSFVYLGIYWSNHHHLIHLISRVDGALLWANLHLLFWLSLVPFVTGWMGENDFAAAPVALYGFILLMAAVAWTILLKAALKREGKQSRLAQAIGNNRKGNISMILYLLGVPAAFVSPWLAGVFFVIVAIMWIVPDRQIERVATQDPE